MVTVSGSTCMPVVESWKRMDGMMSLTLGQFQMVWAYGGRLARDYPGIIQTDPGFQIHECFAEINSDVQWCTANWQAANKDTVVLFSSSVSFTLTAASTYLQ